eukprot:Opistho-2@33249
MEGVRPAVEVGRECGGDSDEEAFVAFIEGKALGWHAQPHVTPAQLDSIPQTIRDLKAALADSNNTVQRLVDSERHWQNQFFALAHSIGQARADGGGDDRHSAVTEGHLQTVGTIASALLRSNEELAASRDECARLKAALTSVVDSPSLCGGHGEAAEYGGGAASVAERDGLRSAQHAVQELSASAGVLGRVWIEESRAFSAVIGDTATALGAAMRKVSVAAQKKSRCVGGGGLADTSTVLGRADEATKTARRAR